MAARGDGRNKRFEFNFGIFVGELRTSTKSIAVFIIAKSIILFKPSCSGPSRGVFPSF